jgi:hypothetical protein
VAKAINGVLAPLGIEPVDPNQIGSAEEVNKLATKLGQAQSRLLGAREAAQIVNQSIEANPGLQTTKQGRQYLFATMDAALARQQQYPKFINDYVNKWHTAQGAEQEFNRQNPPDKYVAQAGVASAPPEFSNPVALNKAIQHLRANPDAATVALFNKIYHNTAAYFLKGAQ